MGQLTKVNGETMLIYREDGDYIASYLDKDKSQVVTLDNDDSYWCTCTYFQHNETCYHIEGVMNYQMVVKRESYIPEEYNTEYELTGDDL